VRRDLLITALVFTAVGFAGGVVYMQYGVSPASEAAGSPSMAMPEDPAGLPEGHPPINLAQQWQTLREKAEANPNDPKAALELANFLFDIERWEDATFWYKRALTLEPKNTDARTDLATCYYNLKRYDEAIQEYTVALELEPDKPQALYGLGLSRLNGKKDLAGARQAHEQLRRNHPNFPWTDELGQRIEAESKRP
jgi:tetratricopeptide (TPR) repeat protein